MRCPAPGPPGWVCGVNNSLKEDEGKTDEPEIYGLAWMTSPKEVQDAEKHRHCGEIG
jgi:hypothetical protein